MDSTYAGLDNIKRCFIPVLVAGDPSMDPSFRAAADESEVRAPMQNAAQLVNSVARSQQVGV